MGKDYRFVKLSCEERCFHRNFNYIAKDFKNFNFVEKDSIYVH